MRLSGKVVTALFISTFIMNVGGLHSRKRSARRMVVYNRQERSLLKAGVEGMSFFTITFVRHGQTNANKEGILQGQSNTQLSEAGVRQAQLVAHRLQNDFFSHIYSSDLDRAAQTAQAIKDGNKASTCTIIHDKRLRERHFGSFQGRSSRELREFQRQEKDDDWSPPGGGEKVKQVQLRAGNFFEDLCHQMRQLRSSRDAGPALEPASAAFSPIPETMFSMDSSPRSHNEDDIPSVDSAMSLGESCPDSPFLHDSDIRTIRSSNSGDGCPNVSLSPLVEQRYVRFSSVSSGRNSFEDTDYFPPNVDDVLVVTHGGWIREMFKVFINDYNCRMSGGNRHALVISPNTGVSRFVVTLPDDSSPVRVTCVFVHDSSHLDAEYKTALDL